MLIIKINKNNKLMININNELMRNINNKINHQYQR